MSGYLPVVIGEAQSLRASVEGLLSDKPDAIVNRIAEQEQLALDKGMQATFAAEIECQFLPDPTKLSITPLHGRESFYAEVVKEMQGGITDGGYGKGAMVLPGFHSKPIMQSPLINGTFNHDSNGPDIVELRTAPASALEALDRYWRTIDAIGKVAAKYGHMAIMMSTHINVAGIYYGPRSTTFMDFGSYIRGGSFLAATHHNLVAMRPLQIDAGLERGIVALEAFPSSKDALTTVHEQRMEFRHPLVGVVDPRVDMLATVSGLLELMNRTIPIRAMRQLRECSVVSFGPDKGDLLGSLNELVVWDEAIRRLVTASILEPSAHGPVNERNLNELVNAVSLGEVPTYMADDGMLLKGLVGAMRHSKRGLYPDPKHRYAKVLEVLFKGANLHHERVSHRVLPTIMFDSPSVHLEQRRNLVKSATARKVMGHAIATLVPAEESVRRRKELIENQMIVTATR